MGDCVERKRGHQCGLWKANTKGTRDVSAQTRRTTFFSTEKRIPKSHGTRL